MGSEGAVGGQTPRFARQASNDGQPSSLDDVYSNFQQNFNSTANLRASGGRGKRGRFSNLYFDLHIWSLQFAGEQDGLVVKTPALGSGGQVFDPRQQTLVQLS